MFYMARNGIKSGGRQKGGLRKRTRELLDILDAAGHCPIADLIYASEMAKKEYKRSAQIFDLICEKRTEDKKQLPTFDNGDKYLGIIVKSAAALAPYMYPKLAALAIQGTNGKDMFASFTEIMKQLSDGSDSGDQKNTIEIPKEPEAIS